MSYTKQTWQAGDEITSAKLNHLEDGINNIATEVANFPVEVNNPQDGDTLIYNAAEQKWVSGSSNSGSGGGSSNVLIVHTQLVDEASGTEVMDKTWQEIHDALASGMVVFVLKVFEESAVNQMPIYEAYIKGSIHTVIADGLAYQTGNKDDYPSWNNSR